MSPFDQAALDQAKAAWAAADSAKDALSAAWWSVGAAIAGAIVNSGVVVAAFVVQRLQANADKNLSDRQDARLLLGATVAIAEAYAGLLSASAAILQAKNADGLRAERTRIGWAEDILCHYLKRELSDYVLVQDLLRVRAAIRAAISRVEIIAAYPQKGLPIEQELPQLSEACLRAAKSFKEIYSRAVSRQPSLRKAGGMPPILIGKSEGISTI